MLDAGYWMLDAGYWMLDTGYWMLDTGYWILDAGFFYHGLTDEHGYVTYEKENTGPV